MKALSTLTALAALTLGTGALAQEKVMVGEPSWPGAKVMSRVIGQAQFAHHRQALCSERFIQLNHIHLLKA